MYGGDLHAWDLPAPRTPIVQPWRFAGKRLLVYHSPVSFVTHVAQALRCPNSQRVVRRDLNTLPALLAAGLRERSPPPIVRVGSRHRDRQCQVPFTLLHPGLICHAVPPSPFFEAKLHDRLTVRGVFELSVALMAPSFLLVMFYL